MVPPGHTAFSWGAGGASAPPPGHTAFSWPRSSAAVAEPTPTHNGELVAEAADGASQRAGEALARRLAAAAAERLRRAADGTNRRLCDPDCAQRLAAGAWGRLPARDAALVGQGVRRVVIGLGSGRCGTRSLAELLGAQRDCRAEHEMLVGGSMLSWEARQLAGKQHRIPDSAADWRLQRVLQQYDVFDRWGTGTAAAVSSSALAYAHEYLTLDAERSSTEESRKPSLRIVVLRRPADQVVRSFLRKTEGRNHWQHVDEWGPGIGPRWARDRTWDATFPNMQAPPATSEPGAATGVWSKADAIRAYWELYYAVAEGLARRHPSRLRVFDMASVLGEEHAQREMLEWCGFSAAELVIDTAIVKNKG